MAGTTLSLTWVSIQSFEFVPEALGLPVAVARDVVGEHDAVAVPLGAQRASVRTRTSIPGMPMSGMYRPKRSAPMVEPASSSARR